MSLLDKASLVQIPSGYKATKLYSVVPDSGAGDFTFARSTTGSRVGSDGLIETGVAIDTPCLDYSGGASCPTLLLEPQRTNQQTYSEDLTNGAWITSNSSVVANQTTSPDGTTTADKVDYGSGSGFIRNGVTLSSATTFSIFIKYFDFQWIQIMTSGDVNHYANFDVQNGVLGNVGSSTEAEIEDYGNGWYRIVAKFVSGTFAGQPRLYKISSGVRPWAGGDGDAGSYYMWGGQQEVGAFQTSYIPTTSSTVTRNADSFQSVNASNWSSVEGTINLNLQAFEGDNTYRQFSLYGSGNDSLVISYTNTSNQITAIMKVGGSTVFYVAATLTDASNLNKIAFAYSSGRAKLFINGIQEGASTASYSTSEGLWTKFCSNIGANYNYYFGKLYGIYLSKTALTDDELATLTTI